MRPLLLFWNRARSHSIVQFVKRDSPHNQATLSMMNFTSQIKSSVTFHADFATNVILLYQHSRCTLVLTLCLANVTFVERASRGLGFFRAMFEHTLVKNPSPVTIAFVALLTSPTFEPTYRHISKLKNTPAKHAIKLLAGWVSLTNTQNRTVKIT